MKRMLLAAGLMLAACSTTAAAPDSAPAPPPAEDQCQAAEHQYLVGRKRSEIPPKPEGAVWRIACTTCPVTMDFNPRRMNIFFDQQTEVIKQVRCG